MRFVTRKTIEKYLEKPPEVKGGWRSFFPKNTFPVLPRIPVLNPEGPTYVISGTDKRELERRQPSIDYFMLCRRAAGDPRYC